MSERVSSVRGSVYLAAYEHKHGTDYSIHTTSKGAEKWFLGIVEEWRGEFRPSDAMLAIMGSDPWEDATLEELVENWTEVSGETEFFNIIEVELEE